MERIKTKQKTIRILSVSLYAIIPILLVCAAVLLWEAKWVGGFGTALLFFACCYLAPLCLRMRYRIEDDLKVAAQLAREPFAPFARVAHLTGLSHDRTQRSIARCRGYGITHGCCFAAKRDEA